MKKVFSIIILIIILTSRAFAIESVKFDDLDSHWAKEYIEILINEKAVNGYGNGKFKPDNNITISEFLKIFIEMTDYELATEGKLWPDCYIQTAKCNNLIAENDFNDFSISITRGEASRIIANYINLEDVVKAPNKFKDLKNNEKEYILKLVKLKILNGYSDNTFRSDNFITRAEACKIILKAYEAKQELLKAKQVKLTSKITNIKTNDSENNEKTNTYEIKDNRIYIYDLGRYAKLNGQTLNQEYINDKTVIKLIESLADEESYIDLKYVPDKYIINSLNIYYGNKSYIANNSDFAFEIKFYENGYYDVAFSKDNTDFMKDAFVKIRTSKMWNKNYEFESDISSSEKNIFKLEEAIGIILDNSIKEEFIEYFKEKRIQANITKNSDAPKIAEVKKIGKYTINTFCINDNDIEFYIKKVK